MSGIRAAIRYAKAILEIADSKGVASEVSADMTLIATTITGNSELTHFIQNPLIKTDTKKNVVLEEIKMYEDTPDDIVHDLLSKACYANHPLGYPILGTEETLRTFTGDSLRGYMADYYTPDRVVISIAGNVDESFIQQVESYFGSFTAKQKASESQAPLFQPQKLVRQKDTEQAHLCIGFNGLPVGHPDIYTLIILNNILGGSMSSRLFQEVREQRGLAYSVFSYHSSYQDSGLLAIYAGTGNNQLDLLFETIQETIDKLKEDGITEKELNNSKEQMKGSLMLGLESTNSRMSRNGKNELLLGRHRSLDEIIEEINSVTVEKVNELARSIFNEDYALALISPSGQLPNRISS